MGWVGARQTRTRESDSVRLQGINCIFCGIQRRGCQWDCSDWEHADVTCVGKVEYASGKGGAIQMEEEEGTFTCFFCLVTLMLVMF